jgi:hypothetical protein
MLSSPRGMGVSRALRERAASRRRVGRERLPVGIGASGGDGMTPQGSSP